MASASKTGLDGTVAQRIRFVRDQLYAGELAVVKKMLENYPMTGLLPVAQLAAGSGVSAPTVLRLVGKLGFPGYAAFQRALRAEVSARLFSPVDVYPDAASGRGTRRDKDDLSNAQAVFVEGIQSTFAQLDAKELDRIVTLLADPSRTIITIGGRFSSVLAVHLGTYVAMLRSGVQIVGAHPDAPLPTLLDIDKKTVAVVFDYRRYQQTTIDWGIDAAKRGAHLVLITDQYLSPLASHSKSMLTNSAAGLKPFDSMASAFALVELIISLLAAKLGKAARTRLSDFEAIRRDKEVTR